MAKGYDVTDIEMTHKHHYGFRSGEWGRIIDLEFVDPGDGPRLCYKVKYEDGVVDQCPVYDPADPYFFRRVPEPQDLSSVGLTIIMEQSTVVSARLHFKDQPGLCAEVQMPWDPDNVYWCTRSYFHYSDDDPHVYVAGPGVWGGKRSKDDWA